MIWDDALYYRVAISCSPSTDNICYTPKTICNQLANRRSCIKLLLNTAAPRKNDNSYETKLRIDVSNGSAHLDKRSFHCERTDASRASLYLRESAPSPLTALYIHSHVFSGRRTIDGVVCSMRATHLHSGPTDISRSENKSRAKFPLLAEAE